MADEKDNVPNSPPPEATPPEKESKDVVLNTPDSSEEDEKKKAKGQRPEREANFQDYMVHLGANIKFSRVVEADLASTFLPMRRNGISWLTLPV